ncbi:CU044_2847 family protein [Saccharothrix sp. BKS2]|uniref:CU044_2847 family protein n=1 Tax=Saccharothrix sp. BKS2 TaxID=3064400 RepID=UPI0039ED57F1
MRTTEIVPVVVGDRVVHVELSVPAGGDVSAQDLVANAAALQDQITAIATWVSGAVTAALPRRPSRVGLDFGLKFGLKAGKLFSFVAEASGEASLVVRLEWDDGDD